MPHHPSASTVKLAVKGMATAMVLVLNYTRCIQYRFGVRKQTLPPVGEKRMK